MRALFVVVLAACGASAKPVTTLDMGQWPSQASDEYDDVTDNWTRRAEIQNVYQQVLEVAATIKSPEWRAAFARRAADHRGVSGAARDQVMAQAQADAAGPYEIVLMVTTWDRRENDLDRGAKSIWTVRLIDEQGSEVAPLEIVKDKRPAFTVRADFPALGEFATTYIARFPRESQAFGPNVKRLRLRMSGSRGAVELVWQTK